MGTLLTFSAFLAFTAANWAVGADAAMVAGLVVSFALLLRNWNRDARREPAVFDLSVFLLFSVLALYDGFGEPLWSATGVQVRVEAGILLAIFGAMLAGRPATLPAVRELLSQPGRADAGFIALNNVLSAAWACAFAVMIAGELLGQSLPDSDPLTSSLVTLGMLSCAECFCRWYVERHPGRGHHGAD
ncbi:hypothetical protein [Variovorax sp. OV329]|uniref:hypothetical protein n=1 Tax=Variovorax sp. OV329 TaxID=1882825 RepID=UPI0008F3CEFB|nr:hypothetical protein [Variovorax sp. OV329]SFM93259.1 hypothetical protein SAMN05444747_111104 [Variovorax sp. OV329]